jgi:RNA polymerase sigma factor (sigma-70 family)
LLDAHGRDVHRFLIATVGRDDADDCYQETWLAALRAYPGLRTTSNLRGWILTIAHHKAIDHVRARGRRAVPVDGAPGMESAAPARQRASSSDVTRPGFTPRTPVAPAAAVDGDLWQLVRTLPDKQRMAIALRFLADADYAEISTVMETSEEAARRNVHEGLKRLRTEYQP